jgi:hypothetical protein
LERKGAGLAARFRQAVSAVSAQASAEEASRERNRAEGARARDELFQDLVAFAQDTGFVAASRDEAGVILRWRGAWIHFQPVGDADGVRVRFEGTAEDEHRLYREALLGDRWVWSWRRRGQEDRLPLFDQGLEALLVRALGLPDPDETPAAPAPEVPAAPVVRRKL